VTTITHPLSYVDTYSYAYSSGQMTSHMDWNSQQTSYFYNDPGKMGRLQSVQNPDTGGYSVSYDDAAPPSVTVTTTTGETSGNIVHATLYDGLGRVQETQLTSDPSGTVLVDTTYDANGRVYSVSNPYRNKNELTYGTIVNSVYDPLDRVKTRIDADGVSTVTYTYAGNCATITDENSNQRTRRSNGLGQMTMVKEPNGVSQSATMETDYGYDVLGNLWTVKQWGGPNGTPASNGPIMRSFAYDNLSRLIAANNPENSSVNNAAALTCSRTAIGTNWTACYGYDSDGNVVSKTDNRGVSILYTYDGLNRLTSKGYLNDFSQTPISCYQYGGPKNVQGYQAGRLMNAWTQSALAGQCTAAPASNLFLTLRTITGYDKMGRVLSEQQCTPSNCSATNSYSLAMNYDLMGNLTSYTNGITSTPGAGSRTLTFAETYDQAGRLQTLNSTWVASSCYRCSNPNRATRVPIQIRCFRTVHLAGCQVRFLGTA
jgi:YD repeat-containing protein